MGNVRGRSTSRPTFPSFRFYFSPMLTWSLSPFDRNKLESADTLTTAYEVYCTVTPKFDQHITQSWRLCSDSW